MKIGIFETKQRLSELVDRAATGEEVVIKRRGRRLARLTAMPEQRERTLRAIFDSIRSSRLRLAKGVTVKSLIEEGRRF
jgi:prevent-host-death family protein